MQTQINEPNTSVVAYQLPPVTFTSSKSFDVGLAANYEFRTHKWALAKLYDYLSMERTEAQLEALNAKYNNSHFCWDYANNKPVSPEDYLLNADSNKRIKVDAVGLLLECLPIAIESFTTWDDILTFCLKLEDQCDLFWFLFNPNYGNATLSSIDLSSIKFTAMRIKYYLDTNDSTLDLFINYVLDDLTDRTLLVD